MSKSEFLLNRDEARAIIGMNKYWEEVFQRELEYITMIILVAMPLAVELIEI